MKTLAHTLLIALSFSAITAFTSMDASAGVPKQPQRPAAYQVGVYGSIDGSKLNVAVNKQVGGRVDIRLVDAKGNVLFHQGISRNEDKYRGKLVISDLPAGTYQLEVSNGIDTTVRTVQISTIVPASEVRTIALL